MFAWVKCYKTVPTQPEFNLYPHPGQCFQFLLQRIFSRKQILTSQCKRKKKKQKQKQNQLCANTSFNFLFISVWERMWEWERTSKQDHKWRSKGLSFPLWAPRISLRASAVTWWALSTQTPPSTRGVCIQWSVLYRRSVYPVKCPLKEECVSSEV